MNLLQHIVFRVKSVDAKDSLFFHNSAIKYTHLKQELVQRNLQKVTQIGVHI